MHLDHLVGAIAGDLMQLINVLGDQRMQDAPRFERDQRTMAGIGLRGPGRMRQPSAPGSLPHLRIGQIVLQG